MLILSSKNVAAPENESGRTVQTIDFESGKIAIPTASPSLFNVAELLKVNVSININIYFC